MHTRLALVLRSQAIQVFNVLQFNVSIKRTSNAGLHSEHLSTCMRTISVRDHSGRDYSLERHRQRGRRDSTSTLASLATYKRLHVSRSNKTTDALQLHSEFLKKRHSVFVGE